MDIDLLFPPTEAVAGDSKKHLRFPLWSSMSAKSIKEFAPARDEALLITIVRRFKNRWHRILLLTWTQDLISAHGTDGRQFPVLQ